MTKSKQLEQELIAMYGQLMSGNDLRKSLGFRSATSFNRAVRTDRLGVRVFHIPGRRGKFVLTKDVAEWLSNISHS